MECVNILDLIRVARQLGKGVSSDSPEDINGDGVVNIFRPHPRRAGNRTELPRRQPKA